MSQIVLRFIGERNCYIRSYQKAKEEQTASIINPTLSHESVNEQGLLFITIHRLNTQLIHNIKSVIMIPRKILDEIRLENENADMTKLQ